MRLTRDALTVGCMVLAPALLECTPRSRGTGAPLDTAAEGTGTPPGGDAGSSAYRPPGEDGSDAGARGPRMTLSAAVRDGELVLRYTVQNNGERDLYLLNRLLESAPPEMGPAFAYVELDPGARIVEVIKNIPASGGASPTSLIAPYVTPVRAGSTFSEEVRLRLPVRITRAYGLAPPARPGDEKSAVVYRGVRMNVGWYWRDVAGKELTETRLGQTVIIPYGGGFPEMHTVRSPVDAVSVPVVPPR